MWKWSGEETSHQECEWIHYLKFIVAWTAGCMSNFPGFRSTGCIWEDQAPQSTTAAAHSGRRSWWLEEYGYRHLSTQLWLPLRRPRLQQPMEFMPQWRLRHHHRQSQSQRQIQQKIHNQKEEAAARILPHHLHPPPVTPQLLPLGIDLLVSYILEWQKIWALRWGNFCDIVDSYN